MCPSGGQPGGPTTFSSRRWPTPQVSTSCCGWPEGEFDMFGVPLREHDVRYDYAQEWLDIILKQWAEDDFDYQGQYFDLKGVRSKPKPYGGTRPIFMNAGNSKAGEEFAGRN